jgi:hypothetical protein
MASKVFFEKQTLWMARCHETDFLSAATLTR